MQVFRTLRNHWKKSLFAFAAVTYGSHWSYQRYQSNEIRRFYCRQAALLGAQTLPSMTPVRRVAVLLNGKAYRNKAKSIFDKTIFPLLHLIGVDVRVYRLDNRADDQALRDLLNKDIESEELSALIVVGGDGTLTRLMPIFLQSATLKSLPICLVPIGENASFARKLFPSTEKKHLHDDLVLLCESVFALFNGTVVQRPTLKITLANEPEKPIYATSLEFGHYSRLEQLQRRLWYFSYLKYPISAVYHLLTNRLESVVSPSSTLSYVNQCSGCSRCQPRSLDDDERSEAERQKPKKSLFSKFYRSTRETTATPAVLPSSTPNVVNPDCGVEHPLERSASLFQMWINVLDNRQAFQWTFADDFQRWNFNAEKPAKETRLVQRLRFDPNATFVAKSFLVDHEKNEQIAGSSECRVEFSEENLKYLQVNPTPLIQRPLTFQPTRAELEEKELGEKGLFLFAQRV